MSAKIAVVGSLNMDLVVRSPRIPLPGETIIGRELHTVPGGKGANQAVAAARLGGAVAMIGRVGQDSFAAALLDNLTANQVDPTWVTQDPTAASGVALIVVDDTAQNSIVVASGANMTLTPQHISEAEAALAAADVLLLQFETPLDSALQAARLARQHGATVVLNPAPAQPIPADLLQAVDVVIPNETETTLLTGLPVHTLAEAETAAQALLASGAPAVVITLGGRGVLLAQSDGAQHVPAFPITPIDTTAAGDAFVGGLAVALGEGKPLVEAIRWGNAAGALAATRLGAQTSLPYRAELLAMLAGEGSA
ncbi:MAG: ribokinase [Anaerolineae bacterium]